MNHDSTDQERRKYPRVSFEGGDIPAKLFARGTVPIDLSATGILVESPRPLSAQTSTTIRLELGPDRHLLVEGRVVRNYVHRLDKYTDGSSTLKYRVAMEFPSLGEKQRDELQEFIHRLENKTVRQEPTIREVVYEGPDRRRVNRILTGVGLGGQISLLLDFEMLQLSAGGMMVSLSVPLPIHSMHLFNVTVDGQSLEVKGEVLNCTPTRPDEESVSYRVVIQFRDLDPQKRDLLERYVSEKLQGGS
jgi:c-di-GMP-binding flagellar brake protein YcgR